MERITNICFQTASPSATRRSHYYRVTYQSLPQKRQGAVETISTTENIVSKVTPIKDYRILLNSYNARGASPLTIITTELGNSGKMLLFLRNNTVLLHSILQQQSKAEVGRIFSFSSYRPPSPMERWGCFYNSTSLG